MDQAGQHLNIWMRPWLGPLSARAVLALAGLRCSEPLLAL